MFASLNCCSIGVPEVKYWQLLSGVVKNQKKFLKNVRLEVHPLFISKTVPNHALHLAVILTSMVLHINLSMAQKLAVSVNATHVNMFKVTTVQ